MGLLTPIWVSEKINELIPRKLPDGRREGLKKRKAEWQKDGQTLIHWTLSDTAGDPKTTIRVSTSKLAKSNHFASFRSESDKLDIDKLEIIPINLSKLTNFVKKWCC